MTGTESPTPPDSLTRLTEQLNAAGGYLNTFGRCSDGDLMIDAAHALARCRWQLMEVTSHLDSLRELLAELGHLDVDHDEMIREAVISAEEMVA